MNRSQIEATLTGGVALLAAVAAALGVFARGDGSFATVTSARGQTYEMATSGVYQWSGRQVVAEGVGWDMFTLFVVVPALLLCGPGLVRGSFRVRLVALGLLGYAVYQYLEYAVTWAFGPLFLLFVAILALAVVAACVLGWSTGVATASMGLREQRSFPRRGWTLLAATMSVLLTVMWLGRIAV